MRASAWSSVLAATLVLSACHHGTSPTSLGNAPGALQAGAGRALIGLPIGIGTAGYLQSRYLGFVMPADEPGSPYVDIFPATRGMESPPTAKVILLDNGVSYMVIAKIDAVGVEDVLTERVIQLAKERIPGKYGDLESKLILNGSHTHDAGCRFGRDSVYSSLCTELGFSQTDPLGNALAHGFDSYSQQATDTVAGAVVEALQQAVSTLQPASFGYTSAWDTEGLAGHDRRCAGDHIYGNGVHDTRAVVMRLDNADTGAPIAIMTRFAMHGTFYDAYNHFLSTDAPGHAEYMIEQQFNEPVVAMYLQGNAGNVSPSGGNNDGQYGEGSSEDMQHAGWELSQLVMNAYNNIDNMQHVLPLQVKERWTAITYDLLGYPPQGQPGDFYPYGSVLCFQLLTNQGTNPNCSPPLEYTPAQIMDTSQGVGICGFAAIAQGAVVNGVPTGSKYATRVAAARIGTLALAAVPGEPVYGTGMLIEQGLVSGEFPGITDSAVIGYSQDHDGYILQDDDWLSGGYEPTISFWGWKYGAYQVQQSIDVFRQMYTGTALYENPPKLIPDMNPDPYTPIKPTDSTSAPAITQDLPSTSERINALFVNFNGGDPGWGTPLITLQTQVNGSWVGVTKPTPACGDLTASCWTSGWIPVTNLSENDIVVWYSATPTFVASPTATARTHAWQFEYEPPIDLPVGSYRFEITGTASQGGTSAPFTLDTATVMITPNTNLKLDTMLTAQTNSPDDTSWTFNATLLYPQLLGLFEDSDNPDWQTANYRALTPRWGVSSVLDTNGLAIPFSPAVPGANIPAATLTGGSGQPASVPLTYVTRTVPDTVYDYFHQPNVGSSLNAQFPYSAGQPFTLAVPSLTDVYGNSSTPVSVPSPPG